MNKTYGIKSLAILYCLYIAIVLFLLFQVNRIQYRHPNSYAVYFLYGAIICLSLFLIVQDISRYQIVTIKDGEIRFHSLNPLKKTIVITISEITGINYIAGKRIEFIITTLYEELKIPVSINIYEARKFCNEIIVAGPHIQVSEPRIEHQYKRTWQVLRFISLAIALLALFIMYYKSGNR